MIPMFVATLTVGPSGMYATPCDAIAAAPEGALIEVDAAGDYTGDTCAWSTDNLTIRGVNGRARIDATGVAVAEQKGIFVIHAEHATIEGFELSGAAVADMNGAGIRHQGTDLVVRDCVFHDNENGILGSPITDGTGTVTIERSEFRHNGAGDGYSHNVYLGHYALVEARDVYSHDGNVGHLWKSRALENRILYSRFTDESGGGASYELDFPNAGSTWIVGSIVQQVGSTQNSGILAYGEETSGMNAALDLHLVNSTIVNDHDRGTFLGIGASVTTAVEVVNTVFAGPGTLSTQASTAFTTSWDDSMGDPGFVDRAGLDYALTEGSPLVDAGSAADVEAEYVHPMDETPRGVGGAATDIGAYEYGNPGVDPGDTGGGDTGGGDTAGTGDTGAGEDTAGETGTKDGCGCGTGSRAGWLGMVIAGLAAGRRRLRG